jgi:hypothetical protein
MSQLTTEDLDYLEGQNRLLRWVMGGVEEEKALESFKGAVPGTHFPGDSAHPQVVVYS